MSAKTEAPPANRERLSAWEAATQGWEPDPPLSAFERYMLAGAHQAGVHNGPGRWPYCAACQMRREYPR
jgi:hypothetical protein